MIQSQTEIMRLHDIIRLPHISRLIHRVKALRNVMLPHRRRQPHIMKHPFIIHVPHTYEAATYCQANILKTRLPNKLKVSQKSKYCYI